jgi:serine/threonine-protein kinase
MPVTAPSSFKPGLAFGKYIALRVVAEGGMATIYEARHAKLGTRVALKVLSRFLRDQPDILARFEREARASAALDSPYVAKVMDVDTTEDGRPYMVMEFLEGRDLEKELQERGVLPWEEAVAYLIEACAAVSVAHRAGIIHRDLKPANIFIAQEGPRRIVKVLDFGISKIPRNEREISATQTHTVLGTPLYMSPEQVRSARDVDFRADVWSLGVILYEAVTGQPPFLRENASAVIAAIVADPVTPPREIQPEIPPALADAIMMALQKDPAQRFQSVEEFAVALSPHAPPWFNPPPIAKDPNVRGRALPAQLTTSLAEALEGDRTIADPRYAPDALRSEPPKAPQRPVTVTAPLPFQPAPAIDPGAAAGTTAGGPRRNLVGFGILLAIVLGIVVGAILGGVVVLASGY